MRNVHGEIVFRFLEFLPQLHLDLKILSFQIKKYFLIAVALTFEVAHEAVDFGEKGLAHFAFAFLSEVGHGVARFHGREGDEVVDGFVLADEIFLFLLFLLFFILLWVELQCGKVLGFRLRLVQFELLLVVELVVVDLFERGLVPNTIAIYIAR